MQPNVYPQVRRHHRARGLLVLIISGSNHESSLPLLLDSVTEEVSRTTVGFRMGWQAPYDHE